jgi:hypothetical protein
VVIRAPEGLVDPEVEVAVQVRGMALDQVTRVAGAIGKGRERIISLIAQHHSIGQEEHTCRTVGMVALEPAGLEQFPDDLKRHKGLARAGGHSQEHTLLLEQQPPDHLADGHLLEIEWALPAQRYGTIRV